MVVRLIITIAFYATLAHPKPIMVSFGTKGGPIIPPTPSTTTLNPLSPKNPAPVHEQVDDVSPPQYRPPTPNQYRNIITSYKPNPNIQLGTPLDIKFQDLNAVGQLQVQQQKAEYARQEGLGYSGAQVFGVQEYEYVNARQRQQQQGQQEAKKLTNAQRFVQQYVPQKQQQIQQIQQNVRQQRHQEKDQAVQGSNNVNVHQVRENQQSYQTPNRPYQYQHYQFNNNNKQNQNQIYENAKNQNRNQFVPGIGIAYSSGLRYYVPQFYYYDSRQQQQQEQQQQQQQQQNYHQALHHVYNDVRDNAVYGH